MRGTMNEFGSSNMFYPPATNGQNVWRSSLGQASIFTRDQLTVPNELKICSYLTSFGRKFIWIAFWSDSVDWWPPFQVTWCWLKRKVLFCGCRYHCLQEVNSYVIQKTNQTVYDMALFLFTRVAVPLMPVFHQHQHQLCLLRQFCFVFINIERFLVFIIIFLNFFFTYALS